MKMYYGNVPIKSMNIKHYEMDTNDATVLASDLQNGVTCYARGSKITGTGKIFEFADYGAFKTNIPIIIDNMINVIEITSTAYPIKSEIPLSEMKNIDFSVSQLIASVVIDAVEYPITTTIDDGMLILYCDKSVTLQVFYGKDNYV